jgi:predicted Fe-Mo cluster-binding NifX family protein
MGIYEGKLCQHFGHSSEFAVIDVDQSSGEIKNSEFFTPPPHEPGILPKWLAGIGVTVIIAGGMGARAQNLFQTAGIEIIVGAESKEPEQLVREYMKGELAQGENICDH